MQLKSTSEMLRYGESESDVLDISNQWFASPAKAAVIIGAAT
jgi:hypothetical protein